MWDTLFITLSFKHDLITLCDWADIGKNLGFFSQNRQIFRSKAYDCKLPFFTDVCYLYTCTSNYIYIIERQHYIYHVRQYNWKEKRFTIKELQFETVRVIASIHNIFFKKGKRAVKIAFYSGAAQWNILTAFIFLISLTRLWYNNLTLAEHEMKNK